MFTTARATQDAIELVHTSVPAARVTQGVVELIERLPATVLMQGVGSLQIDPFEPAVGAFIMEGAGALEICLDASGCVMVGEGSLACVARPGKLLMEGWGTM